jgi:phosphoserine phosphatase
MRATGGFELTIATLIAAGRLDERLVLAALERLPGSRLVRWIDEGDAADIGTNRDAATVRAAFEGWEGVDVVAHPPGPREKALLVADMDSTMIGQECIDELADYAGLKPQVAAITERAMQGELDFVQALAERVALLEGMPEEVLATCFRERVRPNPGAQTLVGTMARRGAFTLLVSGGFTAFARPVAEMIGFQDYEANELGVRDRVLTGRTEGRIVDSRFKRAALESRQAELGLPAGAVMAIGDGANDIPMIEAAGLGIAYRAKPALVAAADARLDHHGLDALLWTQGIPRAEWVEG